MVIGEFLKGDENRMNGTAKLWIVFSVIVVVFSVFALTHATKTSAVASAAPTASDAKTIFDAKCGTCHGKDGRAKSLHAKHVHARNFTDANWQNEVTDERLFNSISNGRNKMPSFKKKLSEEEINSLVSYVRHFR